MSNMIHTLYTKDVAIHPIRFTSARIIGQLKLFKKGKDLYMTWLPYEGQCSNAKLSKEDMTRDTIWGVSFSNIQSICRHTPTLGWQYTRIVMTSGLAFRPFYFYNGGVREFLATIKEHVVLVRSAHDTNVFCVQNPVQFYSLEHPEVPTNVQALMCGSPTASDSHEGELDNSSSIFQNGRRQNHHELRDIAIQVLEIFSCVKQFSSYHSIASIESPKVPVAVDPVEIDKLSLALGKPRQPCLEQEEWGNILDPEGRVMDPIKLRKRIFYGGVSRFLRKEVWGFLLGYHAYDSTLAERVNLKLVKKSEYEKIKSQWESISPEQEKQCTRFRNCKNIIVTDVARTDRTQNFYEKYDNRYLYRMQDILLTYSCYNSDIGYFQGMSDLLSPILYVMKDESESFWCFVYLMERYGPSFTTDGMQSQLSALSKLVELLDSPLHNYFKQKEANDYYFCYRWLLLQFKRELEYDSAMCMWEVLWTHHLSEHLHLYVCAAILMKYRGEIMREQMDHDTIHEFFMNLAGQIDLDSTLREAEALFKLAGEKGVACIPPGTPPSLPVKVTSERMVTLEDLIKAQREV